MRLSNSKKELARIISENGGWREGADTCSCDHDGYVSFFVGNPTRNGGSWLDNGDCEYIGGTIATKYEKIKNWHQTILSSEEYSHLYPAPNADGWIEWKGGECPVGEGVLIDVKKLNGTTELAVSNPEERIWDDPEHRYGIIAYRLHKPEQSKPEFCESVVRSIPEPGEQVWTNPPTIEQLAADYRNAKDYADRKQQDADDAKADADEKLRVLEIAGEALGLLVSPITAKQEPELVIAVQVGDEVECIKSNVNPGKYMGRIGTVSSVDVDDTSTPYLVDFGGEAKIWCHEVKFIRRP